MKRIILIILTLFLIPSICNAGHLQDSIKRVIAFRNFSTAGGGGSCQATPFQGSLSYDNEWDYSIADGAATYYRALRFTASATKSVCKIEAVINVAAGNVSAANYTARIWTMTGDTLDTQLGASTPVTGITGGPTTYTFNFSTPVSITASSGYALTIDRGTTDAANYASWAGNTGVIANWAVDRCESSGACNGAYDPVDLAARLFAYE